MTAFARVPKAVILSAIVARKKEISARRDKLIEETVKLRLSVIDQYRKRWFSRKAKTKDQIWEDYLEKNRWMSLFDLRLEGFEGIRTRYHDYIEPYISLETLCNATEDDTILLSPESVTLLKL